MTNRIIFGLMDIRKVYTNSPAIPMVPMNRAEKTNKKGSATNIHRATDGKEAPYTSTRHTWTQKNLIRTKC